MMKISPLYVDSLLDAITSYLPAADRIVLVMTAKSVAVEATIDPRVTVLVEAAKTYHRRFEQDMTVRECVGLLEQIPEIVLPLFLAGLDLLATAAFQNGVERFPGTLQTIVANQYWNGFDATTPLTYTILYNMSPIGERFKMYTIWDAVVKARLRTLDLTRIPGDIEMIQIFATMPHFASGTKVSLEMFPWIRQRLYRLCHTRDLITACLGVDIAAPIFRGVPQDEDEYLAILVANATQVE